MKNLVNIFNTNDLRYLLDVKVLPENYQVDELVSVMDDIMREDEKLCGRNYYTNYMKESNYAFKDKARLIAISGVQELLLCGYPDEAADIATDWKLEGKDFDELDLLAKRLMQKFAIHNMKGVCKVCGGKESDNCEHCKGTGREPKVKNDFGAMCANINIALKINPRDATVSEFRAYEKTVKIQKQNG